MKQHCRSLCVFNLQSGRRASVFDVGQFDPEIDDLPCWQRRPVDQRALVIDLPLCAFFYVTLYVVGRTSRDFQSVLSS